MGQELRFEPKSLHKGGTDLEKTGHRLHTAWQEMRGTAKGMGDMFGDDMVSGLIMATYQAAEGVAEDCYSSAAKGFTNFGAGLKRMAENYHGSEQKNTHIVEQHRKAV